MERVKKIRDLKWFRSLKKRDFENGAVLEEIEQVFKELIDGDYWMERAKRFLENGGCPVCFCSDEAGHTKGCLWGDTLATLTAERDEARNVIECHEEEIEAKARYIADLQKQLDEAMKTIHRCTCQNEGGQ
jgi:hypothetical protein